MWLLPLVLCVWLTDARSTGIYTAADTYGCDFDLNTSRWGCQSSNWNASVDFPQLFIRAYCQDTSLNGGQKFMWWTGAPKATTDFSLRTGNGAPNTDPTSYVPGQFVSVYVKALKFDNLYKGLLMYAKNGNNSKVGDWVLDYEETPKFAIYPTHMCLRSVMHINAEDKPYTQKFTFVAPPAGTGTIYIRAMLKTGPPNPTDYGDFLKLTQIVLTEATTNDVPVGKWALLNGTENCQQYCSRTNGPACSTVGLSANLDGFNPRPFDLVYPCHSAYFHDCAGNPRADMSKPENFCYHHGANCQSSTGASCTLMPDATTALFCVCGAPITPAPTGPPGTALSPGARVAPGFATLVALLSLGLFSKAQRTWVAALLLLSLMPLVSAHNWLEGTRGRASNLGANQFCSPTFPQLNRNSIHMQVGIRQDVIVEWAAAHNDYTYFIIIHDNARANVSKLTRKFMDDWLLGCPGGGFANTTATGMKYHRFGPNRNLASQAPVNGQSGTSFTYNQTFLPNPIFNGSVWDQFTINNNRPSTFFARNPGGLGYVGTQSGDQYTLPFNRTVWPDTMLAEYRPEHLLQDRRCSYVNASHPWVETIHRYSHQDVASAFATAMIRIEARSGVGRYQIHYKWASYCDVLDVDVQTNFVPAPYGVAINATNVVYDVGQHCFFEKPRLIGQCVEVVTDTAQCAALCNADTRCRAYQLLPLQLDTTRGNDFGLFPEKSYIVWDKNYSWCDSKQFLKAPKQAMVCFPIAAFQDDLNSARPLWSFTDDPDHQGFYSTCFIKPRLVNFTNPVQVAVDADNTFRFGSKCMPCDNIGMNPNNPRWGPQQEYCTDCTLNPTPAKTVPVPPNWQPLPAPANNGTFTGPAHWLSPAGSPYATAEECRALAFRDITCSKYVMFSQLRADRFRTQPIATTTRVNSTYPMLVSVNSSALHYTNYSIDAAYYRSCACLDAPGPAAGTLPPVDATSWTMACAGVATTACLNRGFLVYEII